MHEHGTALSVRWGFCPSLRHQLQTWWTILRIALEERLVYRGDFALGTLMRFLPVVTQIFLWYAVFDSLAAEQGRSEPGMAIRGYSYDDFVAYYLMTMIARAFSSMPGLAGGIASEVRNGDIKRFLIQPLDMIGFLLLARVAHKLAYYSVAIGPFALVFFLCRGYFPGWPPPQVLLAFSLSLVLGFLLGFFLEASLGLLAFWFLEVRSFLFVFMLFSFFLSGHMFPLDMLPRPWDALVRLLPFQFLAYFPAAVFLEKITGPDLSWALWVETTWTLLFIVLSRWLFTRGARRYSAFGG